LWRADFNNAFTNVFAAEAATTRLVTFADPALRRWCVMLWASLAAISRLRSENYNKPEPRLRGLAKYVSKKEPISSIAD
jgi:hypothetical protein